MGVHYGNTGYGVSSFGIQNTGPQNVIDLPQGEVFQRILRELFNDIKLTKFEPIFTRKISSSRTYLKSTNDENENCNLVKKWGYQNFVSGFRTCFH